VDYLTGLSKTRQAARADVSFGLCFEKWEGKRLDQLPYFEMLISFFRKINSDWVMFNELYIDGLRVFSSKGDDFGKNDYSTSVESFLEYTERCRVVSNKFGFDVFFKEGCSYTKEEHKKLAEISDIINGARNYNEGSHLSFASFKLRVDSNYHNINTIVSSDKPMLFRFKDHDYDKISLFGDSFYVPPKTIYVHNVIPNINKDLSSVKPGDLLHVELLPAEGFKCTTTFEDEEGT